MITQVSESALALDSYGNSQAVQWTIDCLRLHLLMIARQLSSACRLGVCHTALRGPYQALAHLHCGALHLRLPTLDVHFRCRTTTAAAQDSFKVKGVNAAAYPEL